MIDLKFVTEQLEEALLLREDGLAIPDWRGIIYNSEVPEEVIKAREAGVKIPPGVYEETRFNLYNLGGTQIEEGFHFGGYMQDKYGWGVIGGLDNESRMEFTKNYAKEVVAQYSNQIGINFDPIIKFLGSLQEMGIVRGTWNTSTRGGFFSMYDLKARINGIEKDTGSISKEKLEEMTKL